MSKLVFVNGAPEPVEVFVEVAGPFLLKPNDKMSIDAIVPAGKEDEFHINILGNEFEIYPPWGKPGEIYINGKKTWPA